MSSALAVLLLLGVQEKRLPASEYESRVVPLVRKYCVPCHGPDKKKGDLDLSVFATQEQVLESLDVWKGAIERLNVFEMPPPKSPQPSFEEKGLLNRWFSRLPKGVLDCRQLATDRSTRFFKGYVMSRRLSRAEFGYSVRDLFNADHDAARDLPEDGSGGEGFDNAGDTLFSSPMLVEKYLEAADRVLRAALPDRPGDRAGAAAVVAETARRAFRRPLETGEADRFMTLYDRVRARGDAHGPALRYALQAILVSPRFLFLIEPEPATEGIHRLDPFPLAQRLSYFLWSSIPDEELFQAAASGKLLEPEVLRAQVRRMLKDPKARALGERFALQWLELEPLGRTVKPDAKKFPEFDDALVASMKAEAARVFTEIVSNDRSLLELIDADWTYADGRLAKLYGLSGVEGPGLRKVALQDRRRGGVLGMAGVLAVSSYPLRTSPVIRGKWILESLLGSKVPPPPPEAPSLAERAADAKPVSLRARLEEHRAKPECASCHSKMDPLGFGLENYDPIGRWRSEADGVPVDASGQLPGGDRFENPGQLKQLLMKRKDEVMTQLSKKMLGFALGRGLNPFDKCVTDDALKALKAEGYRAGALIETIASSFPFQHRYAKK
jgi:hypothetical protein